MVSFFLRKKIIPQIDAAFFFGLLGATCFLYVVFLTSKYQAERYFVPIIVLWEIFLPLFLFALLDQVKMPFLSDEKRGKFIFKLFFTVLIWAYHILLVGQTLYIYYLYKLLS
jgi:hypothetical protein